MESREAWDRQWRSSLLSTLADNLEPAALGLLEEGWRKFFDRMPVEASLLDVGTGNGYLALLALRCNNRFKVYASDFAAIDPQRAVPRLAKELKKIHFFPEMSIEKMCFADQTFDAVVGQHAIEYSDVQQALIEVIRVLKCGGEIRFLLHAEGSLILEANIPKITQFHYVLNKVKIFELAEKTILASLNKEDDRGEVLLQTIEEITEKFREDCNTTDLSILLGLIKNAFLRSKDFENPQNVRNWLQENQAEARAALARIQLMKQSAWSETRLAHFKNLCLMSGCATVQIDRISTPKGAFLGWALWGKKH